MGRQTMKLRGKKSITCPPFLKQIRFSWNAICLTVSPPLCVQVKKNFLRLKEEGLRRDQAERDNDEIELEGGEEDDYDPEREELEDEAEELLDSLPPTLAGLAHGDFPVFCVLSKFLRMLDGTLEIPFFARDASGAILGEGSRSVCFFLNGTSLTAVQARVASGGAGGAQYRQGSEKDHCCDKGGGRRRSATGRL